MVGGQAGTYGEGKEPGWDLGEVAEVASPGKISQCLRPQRSAQSAPLLMLAWAKLYTGSAAAGTAEAASPVFTRKSPFRWEADARLAGHWGIPPATRGGRAQVGLR